MALSSTSSSPLTSIRIEVNGELDVLERAIDQAAHRLTEGGRLCIITFHSLEDRIVKEAYRRQENQMCIRDSSSIVHWRGAGRSANRNGA